MKWFVRLVWFYAIAVLAAGFVAIIYVRGDSRNWSPGFFVGLTGLVLASAVGTWRGQKHKLSSLPHSKPE